MSTEALEAASGELFDWTVVAAVCERAPSACSTFTRASRSVDAGFAGTSAAGNGPVSGFFGDGMSPERVCSSLFWTEGAAGLEVGRGGGGAGGVGGAGGAMNAGFVTADARGSCTTDGETVSFEPPSPRPVRTSAKMSSADRSGPPGSLGGPGEGGVSRCGLCPRAIATSA